MAKNATKIAMLAIAMLIMIGAITASTLPPNTSDVFDPTPTPVGLVVVQGGNNMGPVQAFTLPDVISRTGIRAWHDAGWTGRGQRVGVLDLGFGGLADFESAFNTAVTLMPGVDRSDYSGDTLSHGVEVLEVIHAIAPNAALYACRYGDFDGYVGCIDWFVSAGVRIINHSAGVPALPLDGTNTWAQQVDRAAREGVLWVNAAGNYAGGFVNNVFTDTNTNSYHEFWGTRGLQETLGVNPIEANQGFVMLSWEGIDNIPANAIDLDLEIIDDADQIIASSNRVQRGYPGDTALEWVAFEMNRTFGVRIRDVNGSGVGGRFDLFVEFASVPSGNTQGSVIAPADSQYALTVGALQGRFIAPYSSQGPVGSGAIKPDLVAPGEIILSDGILFVGTSAAAPVVAGLAALVWEGNPVFSREEVYSFIRDLSTQDDSGIAGPDNVYGHGYIYAPFPQNKNVALPPTPTNIVSSLGPSPIPSQTPSVTVLPTPVLSPTETTNSRSVPIAVVNTLSASVLEGPSSIGYYSRFHAERGENLIVLGRMDDWYFVQRQGSDSRKGWIESTAVEIFPPDAQIEEMLNNFAEPVPSTTTDFAQTGVIVWPIQICLRGICEYPERILYPEYFTEETIWSFKATNTSSYPTIARVYWATGDGVVLSLCFQGELGSRQEITCTWTGKDVLTWGTYQREQRTRMSLAIESNFGSDYNTQDFRTYLSALD
ncbi:MAG: S8 family serine peptidase [Anaerolineales bacterium]|nr:S8 family serine peptidase [Anaerolineales bacterium]